MFPEVPQPAYTRKLRATETARIQIVKAPTHTSQPSRTKNLKESHLWVHAGIPATHRILALQTPLQDVTCGGSGVRLNTQT